METELEIMNAMDLRQPLKSGVRHERFSESKISQTADTLACIARLIY